MTLSIYNYYSIKYFNATKCITIHYVFNTGVASLGLIAETHRSGLILYICICLHKLLVLYNELYHTAQYVQH